MLKFTIADCVTLVRLVAVVPLVVLMILNTPTTMLAATIVFVLAALSDALDGYLARRLNIISAFGRCLDPILDKVLVTVTLLLLLAQGTVPGVHAAPIMLIILREIMVAGIREFAAGEGHIIHVTRLAKWKTFVQMVAVTALLAAPALGGELWFYGLAYLFLWVAAGLTLFTGYQYWVGLLPYLREDPPVQDGANTAA